jgi:RNA polymerase sigma factor for flagellar operon FliA
MHDVATAYQALTKTLKGTVRVVWRVPSQVPRTVASGCPDERDVASSRLTLRNLMTQPLHRGPGRFLSRIPISPEALWSACAAGDQSARERLIIEHLGLVYFVARQISRSLSTDVELDELVSSGTMGLMSALANFDVSRGLAFSTFATPRIRGAMLDELRREDHVPRSVRRKTRSMGGSRETLMRELGRMPEDREIAEHMGVDLDTLWRWQADVEGAIVVPLERAPGETDGTWASAPEDTLFDEEETPVDEQLNHEQEVGLLKRALVTLNERERTVLSLYYYEELKLHEIATILRLTESRVSQIRTKALSKLRTELKPLRQQVA